MTYKDIYNQFILTHPELKQYITDYRPAGTMSITIYFNNGMSLQVRYINNLFELIKE